VRPEGLGKLEKIHLIGKRRGVTYEVYPVFKHEGLRGRGVNITKILCLDIRWSAERVLRVITLDERVQSTPGWEASHITETNCVWRKRNLVAVGTSTTLVFIH
jgi:hypothetical protein